MSKWHSTKVECKYPTDVHHLFKYQNKYSKILQFERKGYHTLQHTAMSWLRLMIICNVHIFTDLLDVLWVLPGDYLFKEHRKKNDNIKKIPLTKIIIHTKTSQLLSLQSSSNLSWWTEVSAPSAFEQWCPCVANGKQVGKRDITIAQNQANQKAGRSRENMGLFLVKCAVTTAYHQDRCVCVCKHKHC